MFKYLFYFGALCADIIFYIILWDNDFARKSQETYFILSMFNEPIFFGCMVLSFAMFRKTNYAQAIGVSLVPVLTFIVYYFMFH